MPIHVKCDKNFVTHKAWRMPSLFKQGTLNSLMCVPSKGDEISLLSFCGRAEIHEGERKIPVVYIRVRLGPELRPVAHMCFNHLATKQNTGLTEIF